MEKLEILETRIRNVIDRVRRLKIEKSELETQLKVLTERMRKLEEENRRRENEKQEIRFRVEKILGEIESVPE